MVTSEKQFQNTRGCGDVRSRRVAVLKAAGALVLALITAAVGTGTVLAAVEYDFFLVEAFDVGYDLREVILRDINESGLVTGTATHNGFYDGFVWTVETDKVIVPMLWPQGINNLDQIVSDGRIFDFNGGETITVPPAGTYPVPRLQAINDNQIAVGYSECSCSNSNRVLQEALVWDGVTGSRTVPVPAAKELLRINNGNVAVGNIRGGSAGSEGFVYNLDTGASVNVTDLLPPYMFGRGWSELQDINESNAVAGRGWDGQNIRGLTWSAGEGFTFLPPLASGPIDRVFPRGINASGAVVGFADLTLHVPHAFVWTAQDGMRDLNDLVEGPAGFILDWAIKINDQGWVIGIGHYGPNWGTARGFVLRPNDFTAAVDEPIAIASGPGLRIWPNPVADRLVFKFALPEAGATRLSVYDVAGREVAKVVEGTVSAGNHIASWTSETSQPSGAYFARLETRGQVRAVRFILVR